MIQFNVYYWKGLNYNWVSKKSNESGIAKQTSKQWYFIVEKYGVWIICMFLMLKFISYRDDDLSSIIPNKGTSREKERNGGIGGEGKKRRKMMHARPTDFTQLSKVTTWQAYRQTSGIVTSKLFQMLFLCLASGPSRHISTSPVWEWLALHTNINCPCFTSSSSSLSNWLHKLKELLSSIHSPFPHYFSVVFFWEEASVQ